MNILGWNTGHDGAICFLSDGTLQFSIEAEKGGFHRHSYLSSLPVLRALQMLTAVPDVLSLSGLHPIANFCAPYFGTDDTRIVERSWQFLGKEVRQISSTHERSHLFCSFGLSDLPAGTPCYALVWEGTIGRFYRIDEKMNILAYPEVLSYPGERYVIPFALASGSISATRHAFDPSRLAGKVMALASYEASGPESEEEREMIDAIMKIHLRSADEIRSLANLSIAGIGVEQVSAKKMYRRLSDRIFGYFLDFAKTQFTEKLPLIVGGGCGLNCEWNSRLRDCGLFESVFVPPCVNDSGIAIGCALDAQFRLTGNPKLKWNVFSGEAFELDCEADEELFLKCRYEVKDVANFISQGFIIAWASGRSEIGPRALGARSLLASPFLMESQARLNQIKGREAYRPVAPICLEEDLGQHFAAASSSPYMLYLHHVTSQALKAIRHVDGTARVQSVNQQQHPQMYRLLREFRELSGFGILCNTSLNFPGRGFINRMSDLVRYVAERDIQGFVVEDSFYVKRTHAKYLPGLLA